MDIDEMKDYIMNFSLNNCEPHGNQGYKRVLLQLFGYLGHGKSSFINTCKYVLEDGKFKVHADVASSDGGKTTRRISYKLTSNITLVDNRGCASMSDQETGEIYAQLGNLLPLDEEVLWQTGYQGIMKRLVQADKDANYTDFVVPIFVYSVKKGISQEEVPDIKILLDNAKKLTGINPTVVLTFKSQGNLTDVEEQFRRIGSDNIFKLENFTRTDNLKIRSRHEAVLNFLREVLKDVDFRMSLKRNPKDERADRKEFVLDFAHETDVKEKNRTKEEELAQKSALAMRLQRENERKEEELRRKEAELRKAQETSCTIQ